MNKIGTFLSEDMSPEQLERFLALKAHYLNEAGCWDRTPTGKESAKASRQAMVMLTHDDAPHLAAAIQAKAHNAMYPYYEGPADQKKAASGDDDDLPF